MKLVIRLVLFFSLLVLGGCGYQYDTETLDRSYVNVGTISLGAIDSLILKNDLDHADTNGNVDYVHFYEGYKPFSKTLLKYASEDTSASPITVSFRRDTSATHALSYAIKVSGKWNLWMDIYGCSDINCLSASSIVFHDENYDYVESLTSEDFEFSAPNANYYSKEFGPDCDLYVSYFFKLSIHAERARITMSVQHAKETCDIKLYI